MGGWYGRGRGGGGGGRCACATSELHTFPGPAQPSPSNQHLQPPHRQRLVPPPRQAAGAVSPGGHTRESYGGNHSDPKTKRNLRSGGESGYGGHHLSRNDLRGNEEHHDKVHHHNGLKETNGNRNADTEPQLSSGQPLSDLQRSRNNLADNGSFQHLGRSRKNHGDSRGALDDMRSRSGGSIKDIRGSTDNLNDTAVYRHLTGTGNDLRDSREDMESEKYSGDPRKDPWIKGSRDNRIDTALRHHLAGSKKHLKQSRDNLADIGSQQYFGGPQKDNREPLDNTRHHSQLTGSRKDLRDSSDNLEGMRSRQYPAGPRKDVRRPIDNFDDVRSCDQLEGSRKVLRDSRDNLDGAGSRDNFGGSGQYLRGSRDNLDDTGSRYRLVGSRANLTGSGDNPDVKGSRNYLEKSPKYLRESSDNPGNESSRTHYTRSRQAFSSQNANEMGHQKNENTNSPSTIEYPQNFANRKGLHGFNGSVQSGLNIKTASNHRGPGDIRNERHQKQPGFGSSKDSLEAPSARNQNGKLESRELLNGSSTHYASQTSLPSGTEALSRNSLAQSGSGSPGGVLLTHKPFILSGSSLANTFELKADWRTSSTQQLYLSLHEQPGSASFPLSSSPPLSINSSPAKSISAKTGDPSTRGPTPTTKPSREHDTLHTQGNLWSQDLGGRGSRGVINMAMDDQTIWEEPSEGGVARGSGLDLQFKPQSSQEALVPVASKVS